MPVEPAPSLIRDRLAAAVRGAACDPHWVRLFDTPSADAVAPPARAAVQWRADWLAESRALLMAAKDGGFGFALATDTALRAPIAELLIAALRRRRPDVLTDAFRDRVATAVHEATLNACVHGNLGLSGDDMDAVHAAVAAGARDADLGVDRTVTVVATLDAYALTVDVIDQGAGHNVQDLAQVDAGAADDGGQYSGRGLALIRVFANTVAFFDGGRHIRMTFSTWETGERGE